MSNQSTVKFSRKSLKSTGSKDRLKMDSTLKLEYNSEEDFDAIQNQLKNANVDRIDFTAFKDAANVCDILAKIYANPNVKWISYLVDFKHDLDFEFPTNLEVKKLELHCCDLSFYIWRKMFKATPNVEIIYIYTEQDFNELPQIIQNLSGFKQLKKLTIDVDNVDNPELGREVLSMEEKTSVAQQACKIMKEELPIEVKSKVYELLDLDHFDFNDTPGNEDIYCPANKLTLIEKEANEEPKLVMLQRFV